MATVYTGERFTAANLITGAGVLRAVLISHAQTTAQTVTLYDNTAASGTVLATIHVQPYRSPFVLKLARDDAFRFSTGLSATYTNCELIVWAVKH